MALALIALTAFASPAHAARNTPTYRFDVPPSADLNYSIRARQSGIMLSGDATVRWVATTNAYAVSNEARAMLLGKILDSKSEGEIDRYGLAPLRFTEKRFRKDPTTTSFDRVAHTIRFSASKQTYPITGGEQDRDSAIWQLIAVARAQPAAFKPGSDWHFFVAGQRDADPWSFKVIARERLATPLGETKTVHVLKEPPLDKPKAQRVDIWLAPTYHWYPVRLRYAEADGDFIEQTLEAIDSESR